HRLSLTRSANGWEFDHTTIKFQADDGIVSALVDAITHVEAVVFHNAEIPRNSMRLPIELTALGQNEPVILNVREHARDPQVQPVWLVNPRHEQVVMKVSAQKLTDALSQAWQLRDRTLVDLPAGRVNHLTLIREGKPELVLTRQLPTPVNEVTVGA